MKAKTFIIIHSERIITRDLATVLDLCTIIWQSSEASLFTYYLAFSGKGKGTEHFLGLGFPWHPH